jgi:hypothetical protein
MESKRKSINSEECMIKLMNRQRQKKAQIDFFGTTFKVVMVKNQKNLIQNTNKKKLEIRKEKRLRLEKIGKKVITNSCPGQLYIQLNQSHIKLMTL